MFFRSILRFVAASTALLQLTMLSVCAFETNGDVDTSFDAGRITSATVFSCVAQPDGKVVVFGDFGKANEAGRKFLARFNADGTLDSSFVPSERFFLVGRGGLYGPHLILQPDNKLLVVDTDSDSRAVGIARLNSDGSLDVAFNPGRAISRDGSSDGSGAATNPGRVNAAVLQSDGKVVVLGEFSYIITGPGTSVARSGLARFNADGTFDSTYNPGAGLHIVAPDTGETQYLLVKQSGGKMILTGPFDTFDGHSIPGMVRLNTDGSFDSTFSPGSATDFTKVDGCFVQSDDMILMFGRPASFNGVSHYGIVRLTADGAVDGTFTVAEFKNYGDPGEVTRVVQQADGKLVAVGLFHSLGAVTVHSIVRLQANGSRDATFDASSASGICGEVFTAAVRSSDQEIFAAGFFTTYNGSLRNNIALVKANGALDTTFAPVTGLTDDSTSVRATVTQADGKIIAAGTFSSVSGVPHRGIVRLNRNGALDNSFGVTKGTDGSVITMIVQPDNKILIAGGFTAVDSVARGRIARLNADGTLDPAFNPGTGPNAFVRAMAIDSAGSVYITGDFSSVNGVTRNTLAKLSSSGVLDASFDPGSGLRFADLTGSGNAITPPTAAGGPVVVGAFDHYNGTGVDNIVRLNPTTGGIDAQFSSPAQRDFSGFFNDIKTTADGKYVVSGHLSRFSNQFAVARLNTDGSTDASFASPITCGAGTGAAVIGLQGSKVFVSGRNCQGRNAIITHVQTNGYVDFSFNTGDGADNSDQGMSNEAIFSLATQPDGKLLVGGRFDVYNGNRHDCLVRLSDARYKITDLTRLQNMHISLQGVGPPNAQLSVFAGPNLNQNSFMQLTTLTINSQGTFSYDDAGAVNMSPRFYELRIP
jgi:uncharacterized delta-60 repeat protein